MRLRTLLNKTQGDGKYIFAQPTMIFRNKDDNSSSRLHVVREDEVTRPDLIALEHYGDQTKTDLILKWNGISDPFSLQPGDELIIPPSGVAYNKLERPAASEDNKIKNQFLQSKRFTKKDQRRLDALKKKYNKEVLLPPNVIPVGQKNYKFDKDGNIIFGAQAQNGEVNGSSNTNGGFGSGGGSGNGTGSGGSDAVVDAIFDDLGQDLRDSILAAQGSGGSGSGSGGSGNGSGKDLTENQLENNLNNGVGKGRETNSSGKGAGNGSGSGNGSGNGGGTNANSNGTNSNSSSSPQGSSNADGVANDGAPCN
jgi:hypothetical protein